MSTCNAWLNTHTKKCFNKSPEHRHFVMHFKIVRLLYPGGTVVPHSLPLPLESVENMSLKSLLMSDTTIHKPLCRMLFFFFLWQVKKNKKILLQYFITIQLLLYIFYCCSERVAEQIWHHPVPYCDFTRWR